MNKKSLIGLVILGSAAFAVGILITMFGFGSIKEPIALSNALCQFSIVAALLGAAVKATEGDLGSKRGILEMQYAPLALIAVIVPIMNYIGSIGDKPAVLIISIGAVLTIVMIFSYRKIATGSIFLDLD